MAINRSINRRLRDSKSTGSFKKAVQSRPRQSSSGKAKVAATANAIRSKSIKKK